MKKLLLPGAAAALAAVALFVRSGDEAPKRAPAAAMVRPQEELFQPEAPVTSAEVSVETPAREPALDELQQRLAKEVEEGTLTAKGLVDRFGTESDGATLDVLQGILAGNPEMADQPGVLEAFFRFAMADSCRDRRQAALVYLGTAWDKDGRVLEALLEVAKRDRDDEIRVTAVAALRDYGVKNHDREADLGAALLALAWTERDASIRARVVTAIPSGAASADRVRQVAAYLEDSAGTVRRAAAEWLEVTPEALWPQVRPSLQAAASREPEPEVREALLVTLMQGDARNNR